MDDKYTINLMTKIRGYPNILNHPSVQESKAKYILVAYYERVLTIWHIFFIQEKDFWIKKLYIYTLLQFEPVFSSYWI